jgi:hypothetical protein
LTELQILSLQYDLILDPFGKEVISKNKNANGMDFHIDVREAYI